MTNARCPTATGMATALMGNVHVSEAIKESSARKVRASKMYVGKKRMKVACCSCINVLIGNLNLASI